MVPYSIFVNLGGFMPRSKSSVQKASRSKVATEKHNILFGKPHKYKPIFVGLERRLINGVECMVGYHESATGRLVLNYWAVHADRGMRMEPGWIPLPNKDARWSDLKYEGRTRVLLQIEQWKTEGVIEPEEWSDGQSTVVRREKDASDRITIWDPAVMVALDSRDLLNEFIKSCSMCTLVEGAYLIFADWMTQKQLKEFDLRRMSWLKDNMDGIKEGVFRFAEQCASYVAEEGYGDKIVASVRDTFAEYFLSQLETYHLPYIEPSLEEEGFNQDVKSILQTKGLDYFARYYPTTLHLGPDMTHIDCSSMYK
jgi:hypothetical protein